MLSVVVRVTLTDVRALCWFAKTQQKSSALSFLGRLSSKVPLHLGEEIVSCRPLNSVDFLTLLETDSILTHNLQFVARTSDSRGRCMRATSSPSFPLALTNESAINTKCCQLEVLD